MDVDFTSLSPNVRYKLLTALVVPRPIAWVSTLNEDGSVNAAPYSFFNVLGNKPPLVALGPGDRLDGSPKDTPANIERMGEFVVNLVDYECAEKMHHTAAPFPSGTSETDALKIATEASTAIKTPRIVDSKVHLECAHHSTIEIEGNRVVFGLVKHLHVIDGLLEEDTYRIEPGAFEGVGRLQGPGWYCRGSERFDLGRFPSVKSVMEGREEEK